MARRRQPSEAAFEDQAVVAPESETKFGGSGNVAFFFFTSYELNHLNLPKKKIPFFADAEEDLIVATENCKYMEIDKKELTVVCRRRIDYYIWMPLSLLGPLGTGVTIFMIVPALTFLLLFALPLLILC